MALPTETIAAIATPQGEGGIAIVRVSGPDALSIVSRLFSGRHSITTAASHTVHVGLLTAGNGQTLDQVVCSLFRAPHSYTGEDVVEIGCHGGLLNTRRILEALLTEGIRHAAPGEFTKRAFLNGRIDLAQAEAVADLIHASSDRARQTSMRHLQGEYSAHIETLRLSLLDTLGLLELELDFAEDGYEFADKGKLQNLISGALNQVQSLATSFNAGKLLREGIRVAIVGAPNAGKSSLLNTILRENRAIVTEVPGTTRDVISERILIDGVLFNLSDTAGLRPTEDPAEKEGVRRSMQSLQSSDIVLLVQDLSRSRSTQMEEIGASTIELLRSRPEGLIEVWSKADLGSGWSEGPADRLVEGAPVIVSAFTGAGIHQLEKAIMGKIPKELQIDAPEGDIVVNSRHFEVFLRVKESLTLALNSVSGGNSAEFIAVDLREALEGLGEITGRVANEDVLNSIFARFCIGK